MSPPTDPCLTPWRTLHRQQVFAAPPWLAVHREAVELPGGRVLDDFYQIALPPFVVVIAWVRPGELLMVRGYKHGVRGINLSPPAGLIDPGEEPLAAARRELLEETGHATDRWEALGHFTVDGNRGCGTMHLFAAHDVRAVGSPLADDSELLTVTVMGVDEVLEALRRGEVANLAGAGGFALGLLLTSGSTREVS